MSTEKKNREPDAAEPETPGSSLPVPVVPQVPALVSGSVRKAEAPPDPGEKAEGNVSLTIIPVRNAILFPQTIIPFVGGRDLSLEAVERAARQGDLVGIVAQKDGQQDSAKPPNLHRVGTEAKVAKVLRLPDGTFGVVVQGIRRFRILRYTTLTPTETAAEVEYFNEDPTLPDSLEMTALAKGLKQLVQRAIALSPSIPNEVSIFIENIQDAAYLSNIIIPYLSLDLSHKQEILEIQDTTERIQRIHLLLAHEIEILEMSQRIHADVRGEMNKQQRRYYVKEQIRLLQKEMGDLDDKPSARREEQEDLGTRVEKSAMPQEARDAAFREVERLKGMQPGAPEFVVSQTYVNWLLDIPWAKHTQNTISLAEARKVLDEDHHGLQRVKKRILEHIAVLALRDSLKGPILLLVGPPGVGKTSLGQSVARALGRKFARISLGGVRDEADIRGHRRTYIGSMPGRIVEALKRAGSMDPVILLDEVDKLSADNRGDPASALLEVLDSEQNNSFVDHYLNVPVDLSKVLFLCTANNLYSIPEPLKDRMEIIELPGYTPHEKSAIAFEHLVPKVVEEHGLTEHARLQIPPEMMDTIINSYTREAGVRQLRRELATLARNVACEIVTRKDEDRKPRKSTSKRCPRKLIDPEFIRKALGPVRFLETRRQESLKPGVATGLAYTPVGGDVLFVESVLSDAGSGRITITGQLGDVMRESVETALAYLRSHAKLYGVRELNLSKRDLHIHFPEGAVKKDGPSAGVAIFLALAGLFLGRSLSARLAVTGEISLRGEILPVGGIREKLIAAHRHGIRTVLIPRENEKDLEDIPIQIKDEMTIIPVTQMHDAFERAFPHSRRRSPSNKFE